MGGGVQPETSLELFQSLILVFAGIARLILAGHSRKNSLPERTVLGKISRLKNLFQTYIQRNV